VDYMDKALAGEGPTIKVQILSPPLSLKGLLTGENTSQEPFALHGHYFCPNCGKFVMSQDKVKIDAERRRASASVDGRLGQQRRD